MTPEEWRHIKSVFQGALELSPAQRIVLLAAQSESVRGEVESLLRAYEHDNALPETLGSDTPATLQDDQELIGRRFGPYRVLSHLGEGGMGTVWLAERVDGMFTRRVALKLVHPVLMGRSMSERVAREREILASLNHPNIAQLFDAGFAEDGQPYLALEYVEGTPLTLYCDDHHLGVDERLVLFRQVLGAVQYAHSHLVIHRDLKPSNILVSDDGQTHLLDFGIAKLLTPGGTHETQLTQLPGRALTPDYAAPEQIAGGPTSTAADVYALGVILYELLSGERPYQLTRPSRGALEEAILQTEPLAPSRLPITPGAARARATSAQRLARSLKGDLDTIIGQALKKSPSERYASVTAFDADIGRFLSGEVVLARPDSLAYRVRKFGARHRAGIAGISLLLLTLAAGLAATTYEAHTASAERDGALEAQRRSLAQAAAGRLKADDVPGALAIVLQLLAHEGNKHPYPADALNVFQEARAADGQLMALTGHTDIVVSAAFSPDGQRIVTASYDKTARVWDAATGQQLMVLSGHAKGVRSAAFSPDGQRIVTTSLDKSVRLWDAGSGQTLLTLSGHTDRVNSAAFSPDGRRIVTTSFDKTARVWDATSGRTVLVLSGHTGFVRAAAFSPDGQQIVTAADDHTARVWDSSSGRLLRLLSGHTAPVDGAVFSPDGRWIVTASEDRTARRWDAASGEQRDILRGHAAYVDGVAISPDGRRIVTGSGDKTVRLWDATSGEQLRVMSGHVSFVFSVAFSPDGRRMVSTSFDRTARVWDSESPRQLMVLRGHPGYVVSAAFSPDGRRILTAGEETARLWDAADGRELRVLSGHTAGVATAAFSPDGSRIVTSSGDRTARVWDPGSGEQLRILSGHTDAVHGAMFSPDGQRILTASVDKTARVWDATSGEQLRVLSGHMTELASAVYSPDGRRVVTASLDKTARIWDVASGKQLLVVSGDTAFRGAAFSPDGREIVTSSDDKTARIWDVASGEPLKVLSGHGDLVGKATFSTDGQHIVTVSLDRTARLWDAASGEQLQVLSGHTAPVIRAAFSSDGQRVVTASLDMTARVWDARTVPIEAQLASVEAAQFERLSSTESSQLGLADPADVRRWPADGSKCDQAAAAPYDPARHAAGVTLEHIAADLALSACAPKNDVGSARAAYQHGRALFASGEVPAARKDFERAIALGYSAAQVDLGNLLTRPSAGVSDARRAVALYERAWSEGVSIAAFELGALYEHGLDPASGSTGRPLAADESRAWSWYQKGADTGEPNALARLALREDRAALAAANTTDREKNLLHAFRLYAAASERARLEDWPDDAWHNWRYRRASLARLLARAGMTQEVADAYNSVRKKYAPSVSPMRRIFSSLGGDLRASD